MYRVYLGNLDQNATEEDLQKLFFDHDLIPSNILIKKGFGFVDCPDQSTFDKTIDKLNGVKFMSLCLQVEPSTVSKKRRSSKIKITNLPENLDKDEIKELLESKGHVLRCDIMTSSLDRWVAVEYDLINSAQKALDELNNTDYQGSILQVDFQNVREGRMGRPGKRLSNAGNLNANEEVYILRILVPTDFVGAIIGKKGQTIQNITSSTKVLKIDIHGKDSSGLMEKAIFIAGKNLDSVSNACHQILQVIQTEATSLNKGEAVLKLLADDRHCGRVIGKEGKVIKKIRDDTNTKIVVSGSEDMMSTFPDRIIVVKGTVEEMSQAETAISAILYTCMQRDALQNSMMSMDNRRSGYQPQQMTRQRSFSTAADKQRDNYYITVPNAVVGALIGTAGSNIKQIIRDSNSLVTIEAKKDGDAASDRSVCVKGTAEGFWKASCMIFEKMKIEGFAGNDDVRLCTLMTIPKNSVGRIIGKGGKNAREIEQGTGAIVRITDDPRASEEEAMVEVCGTFTASQGALSRIRTIVTSQKARLARSASPRDRGDHQSISE